MSHARAAKVWAYRARVEVEASRRFARLARELSETGAAPVVVELAQSAAADELHHAELCDALVAHFGATPQPRRVLDTTPVGPSGVTERERVLFEVIAMSCVTETVSAVVLKAMQDEATDPLVRESVHVILRDEVKHSRLGWAHLASERKRGPLGFVSDYLPAMLSETVSSEIFDDVDEDAELARALAGSGALPRSARKRLFVEALSEVVFPGFEHIGIDTAPGRRWLDANGTNAAQ